MVLTIALVNIKRIICFARISTLYSSGLYNKVNFGDFLILHPRIHIKESF